MTAGQRKYSLAAVMIAAALLSLVGCSGRDGELEEFIAARRSRPVATSRRCRGEALPELHLRGADAALAVHARLGGAGGGAGASVRPIQAHREFLEQFSLDTLRMVGTLKLGGQNLARQDEGRAGASRAAGNYLGQSEGKILGSSRRKISLVEIVRMARRTWKDRDAGADE